MVEKKEVAESVIKIIKAPLEIEHTSHLYPWNALTHMVARLVAYDFRENKPSTYIDLKYLEQNKKAMKKQYK